MFALAYGADELGLTSVTIAAQALGLLCFSAPFLRLLYGALTFRCPRCGALGAFHREDEPPNAMSANCRRTTCHRAILIRTGGNRDKAYYLPRLRMLEREVHIGSTITLSPAIWAGARSPKIRAACSPNLAMVEGIIRGLAAAASSLYVLGRELAAIKALGDFQSAGEPHIEQRDEEISPPSPRKSARPAAPVRKALSRGR